MNKYLNSYDFLFRDESILKLPADVKILCVVPKTEDVATIYTIGTIASPIEKLRFFIGRTAGHDIPDNYEYIQSFFVGDVTWHIFEIMEVPA